MIALDRMRDIPSSVGDKSAARQLFVDPAVITLHKSHPREAQRRKTLRDGTSSRGAFAYIPLISFSTEKNEGF